MIWPGEEVRFSKRPSTVAFMIRAFHPAPSSSTDERVPRLERRKTTEVSVCGEQLGDARRQTDRGDARVVNHRADHSTRGEQIAEAYPMVGSFREDRERRGLEPAPDLLDCLLDGAGRIEDAWVRDLCVELVKTWPGHGPLHGALREPAQDRSGASMKRGVRAVRVYQHVGVDGDHGSDS